MYSRVNAVNEENDINFVGSAEAFVSCRRYSDL